MTLTLPWSCCLPWLDRLKNAWSCLRSPGLMQSRAFMFPHSLVAKPKCGDALCPILHHHRHAIRGTWCGCMFPLRTHVQALMLSYWSRHPLYGSRSGSAWHSATAFSSLFDGIRLCQCHTVSGFEPFHYHLSDWVYSIHMAT